MNCEQAEERLSPYLDGMLTQDERREIAIHLQSCSRCMALLAEFRQNDILLARLPRVSPAASLHERIFSTPEMIELAKNASSRSFFFDEPTRSLPPIWQSTSERIDRLRPVSPGSSHSPREATIEISPTPPTISTHPAPPAPVRDKKHLATPLKIVIAAAFILSLGTASLLSLSLHHTTAGADTAGAITPPAAAPGSGQSIPLAAGTRFVFLQDYALWSTLADGSKQQPQRLTPPSVTVAPGWLVSPTPTGHTAGDMLAYIDLRSATVHTIRSDGQQDTPIRQTLLKTGGATASAWNSQMGETILNSLAWSKDGSMLAFVGDPTSSGQANLYLYSLATGKVQEILPGTRGSVAHPAWSPDSTRMAFTVTQDGVTSVLDYNVRTRQVLDLSNLQAAQGTSANGVLTLAWSPATSDPAVTWSLGSIGHITSLWIHRVGTDGTIYPQQLASGDYLQALYSPQGDNGVGAWLLVATNAGQAGDIWRIDLRPGAELIPSSQGKQVSFAAWSPDGSTIFYLDGQTSGAGQGYLVNVTTGASYWLANGVRINPAPTWSADSSQLAYSTGTRINIANASNGSQLAQLQLRGLAANLSWSPAATHQMVVALANGKPGIYLIDTSHNTSLQLGQQSINGQIQWTEIP